jgi:DNA-binding IclR family transcriptional regulator
MGETNGVKAVNTTFGIVEYLVDEGGARITDIAEDLGLAKSTVHQQLTTLRELGYAVQEDGRYHVGLRFLSMGEHARGRNEAYNYARPMVKNLAEETGERAQFFVEEHGRAVILYLEEGEHGVTADRHTGKIRYMHSSAGGKAMLAHMDQERVEEVIERWGLPAETPNTITDREALFDELRTIRGRGYAVNHGESISGLRAYAAPIVANGDVMGSFSVPGPLHRMETEWFREELPSLLRGTANELEIRLEYADK